VRAFSKSVRYRRYKAAKGSHTKMVGPKRHHMSTVVLAQQALWETEARC